MRVRVKAKGGSRGCEDAMQGCAPQLVEALPWRVPFHGTEGEQLHYSITDARRQSVIWTWP